MTSWQPLDAHEDWIKQNGGILHTAQGCPSEQRLAAWKGYHSWYRSPDWDFSGKNRGHPSVSTNQWDFGTSPFPVRFVSCLLAVSIHVTSMLAQLNHQVLTQSQAEYTIERVDFCWQNTPIVPMFSKSNPGNEKLTTQLFLGKRIDSASVPFESNRCCKMLDSDPLRVQRCKRIRGPWTL